MQLEKKLCDFCCAVKGIKSCPLVVLGKVCGEREIAMQGITEEIVGMEDEGK